MLFAFKAASCSSRFSMPFDAAATDSSIISSILRLAVRSFWGSPKGSIAYQLPIDVIFLFSSNISAILTTISCGRASMDVKC